MTREEAEKNFDKVFDISDKEIIDDIDSFFETEEEEDELSIIFDIKAVTKEGLEAMLSGLTSKEVEQVKLTFNDAFDIAIQHSKQRLFQRIQKTLEEAGIDKSELIDLVKRSEIEKHKPKAIRRTFHLDGKVKTVSVRGRLKAEVQAEIDKHGLTRQQFIDKLDAGEFPEYEA